MDERTDRPDDQVDPKGEAMYQEVLKKRIFDDHHLPPLRGVREFTINHLFAKVWSRSSKEVSAPTISLRERRLITIALLAAQGRSDQLRDHVVGAFRSGLNEVELLEVMIQVAHYAGWPAGTSGQSIVQHVFEEEKKQKSDPHAFLDTNEP